jgi:hypothetical protein
VFKETFGVDGDDNFVGFTSADPDLVQAHEHGEAQPDEDDLEFDFTKGPDSPWNSVVLDILAQKIKIARHESAVRYAKCPREYWLDMVREKYIHARSTWKRGQPRLTSEDVPETPDEVESRLLTSKGSQLQKARNSEWRTMVSEEREV